MFRILSILMVVLFSFSCSDKNKTNVEKEIKSPISFKVEYHGALKNMMHNADISSKFELSKFKDRKNVYAIGAYENLKGEIQIFNSIPSNTYIKDSSINFDKSFDKNATLIVSAEVSKWKNYQIPSNIHSYEELEKHIALIAEQNGINIHEPFPFLVSGVISSLDWHVINWKDGDMEHTHEKHVNSGLNGTIENQELELLGFYSDSHHRIFTHHSTNMHIHFKTDDNLLAGHVDGLILGKGMIVKLPVIN